MWGMISSPQMGHNQQTQNRLNQIKATLTAIGFIKLWESAQKRYVQQKMASSVGGNVLCLVK